MIVQASLNFDEQDIDSHLCELKAWEISMNLGL